MVDQPELDLSPVETPAMTKVAASGGRGFGGFTRAQIAIGALLLALAVWGMWVTRTLTAPRQDHIVSARLSALVGDYVEAQRYSGSPPEQVRTEMQAFMVSLDKELQRRSADGQIVMVGEAVLTRNVPDITESLKSAVYAAGVPVPKRVSAEAMQRMQQAAAAQTALGTSQQSPLTMPGAIDPMAGASPLMPPAPVAAPMPSQPASQIAPGASVSTFGGPDANGGQ